MKIWVPDEQQSRTCLKKYIDSGREIGFFFDSFQNSAGFSGLSEFEFPAKKITIKILSESTMIRSPYALRVSYMLLFLEQCNAVFETKWR